MMKMWGYSTSILGCKIEHDEALIRFTQLVLLQSFEDEFKCKTSKVMVNCDQEKALSEGEQTHYRSGVRKLLVKTGDLQCSLGSFKVYNQEL